MKYILLVFINSIVLVASAQFSSPGSNPFTNGYATFTVGTVSPQNVLRVASTSSAMIRIEKAAGSEGGFEFNAAGTPKFYFWSDNQDADALKISAAGLAGEHDGLPRMMFPSDNTNIFMAQSGGRVGIGTNNPQAKLHITGQAGTWTTAAWNKALEIPNASVLKWSTPQGNQWQYGMGQTDDGFYFIRNNADNNTGVAKYDMFISHGGHIGIGTNAPNARLQIVGQGGPWTTADWRKAIEIPDASVLKWSSNTQGWKFGMGQSSSGFYFIRSNSDDGSSNPNYDMFVSNDGNVGIGTSAPDTRLTVNGSIHTKEIKVDLDVPAPDYVFEEDYDLQSLQEIESYIRQHKHLPEVPSAKDMEEEGVNLKEMNLILLKKVEELTLHLIEQSKTNLDLLNRVRVLEDETRRLTVERRKY